MPVYNKMVEDVGENTIFFNTVACKIVENAE